MRQNKILLPLLTAILPALVSCVAGSPARPVTADTPVKRPTIIPHATQAAIPISFSPALENANVPLWVTEFADPILEAVTDQKPFFQDDFSRNLGWFNVMSGAAWPLYAERYDGMLFLNLPERTADSVLYHPKLDLENFVLVLDLRFVHDQPDDTVRFQFDRSPHQSVTLDLSNNRKWKLQSGFQDNWQSVEGIYEHFPPEHIPMTILMRGAECAVYL